MPEAPAPLAALSPRRSDFVSCGALVALLLVLGACGAGGGGRSIEPTPIPLTVTHVAPPTGTTLVDPATLAFGITFSHPVDPTTATSGNVQVTVNGSPVAAAVSLDGSGLVLNVVPGGVLPPLALVSCSLLDIERLDDGEPLASHQRGPWTLEVAPTTTDIPLPPGDRGRYAAAVATLADASLLVAGGLGDDGLVRMDAERGSADGLIWTPVPTTLAQGRWKAVATAVEGGALIVGGFTDPTGSTPTESTERFDAAAAAFSPGPVLGIARGEPTLVRSSEGTIVVFGGSATENGPAISSTIEGYDPAAGVFVTLDAEFATPLTRAAAAPLADGRVLVAGGVNGLGAVLDAASLLVPEDEGEIVATDPLNVAREAATAVLAPTGMVYVFGGRDGLGNALSSIERYDPTTEEFTLIAATLSQARHHAHAIVLANGAIAVIGGETGTTPPVSAVIDIFDPSTDSMISSTSLPLPVTGAAVFALANGNAIVYGGAEDVDRPPTNVTARTILSPAALGSAIVAPRVVAISPAPGSDHIDVDTTIEVRFSKLVDEDSLDGAITLTDAENKVVAGTIDLLDDGITARFVPTAPLPVRQRVAVEVTTDVTDLIGQALQDDGSRFGNFTTAYDWTIGAADDGSQFGYSTAVGDVNGDGVDDIVVSAYVAEPNPGSGVNPGQVYVVLGRADIGPSSPPLLRDLSSASSAADLTITFETDGDQPGIESALQVGDFDDDGYDDILVGVHSADGPNETESNRGELFVIFGQAAFPVPQLQLGNAPVAGFDVLRVYGKSSGDRFGEGMAMGDVDGDGILDALVGARFADTAGGSNVGGIYVLFGGSKSTLGIVGGYGEDVAGPSASTIVNFALLGTDASDSLGWTAAAPDIDGDGYAEVVGGSTAGDGPTNAATSAGEALVVFGAPRSTLVPSGTYREVRGGSSSDLPGFTLCGADAGDLMGWGLGSGDVDLDGYDDLCIGGTQGDGLNNAGSGRGEIAVLFGGARSTILPDAMATWETYQVGGAIPTRMLRIHGEADGHSFGDCFLVRDLDGDDAPDLLVGDYQARGPLDSIGANVGEVSVLHGDAGLVPSAGATLEFELSTDGSTHPGGVRLTRFYGKAVVVRFGTTLAAGDLNADGHVDLVTGANRAKGFGHLFANGGEAYVLWGRATWWK